MKVLQINSVYGSGSTGRIVADIAQVLRQENIDSYVAYGRGDVTQDSNGSVFKIGEKWDNYLHGMFTRVFDKHALWGSEKATHELVAWVESVNPDIIHLHNLHGYYINIKILFDYLRKANKPVVWTLHDCWSFTGHCAHFSYVGCTKWQTGCHHCLQKRMYPTSILFDSAQSNYQKKQHLFAGLSNMTIVTPSQWLAKLVGQSFLSKYPIKVIPNGVDVDVFQPVSGEPIRKKFKLENKFFILGVAGVWGERKGLQYFIELSKMIGDDCRILLVGLEKKIISRLPAKVIGVEKTTDIYELARIYSAADVLVNPSLEETFGLVTVESMACGTPTIVFDKTPGVEIVTSGCGYVTEMENTNEIKKKLELIRSNGKMYYFPKCVQKVREMFDKNDCFNQYVNLYRMVSKDGNL